MHKALGAVNLPQPAFRASPQVCPAIAAVLSCCWPLVADPGERFLDGDRFSGVTRWAGLFRRRRTGHKDGEDMKRDMDLVRKILLAVEDSEEMVDQNPEIEGYTKDQVDYHVWLMLEAGLVYGAEVTTLESDNMQGAVSNLTWDGHEFLDLARDETTWNKATAKIRNVTGALSFAAVRAVLTDYATQAAAQIATTMAAGGG